jgi:radical SAM protein with 4Fe4S-binding SPASM domain
MTRQHSPLSGKEPVTPSAAVVPSEGLRAPKMLTLAITGACNLTCGHCWVRAGEAASSADVPVGTIRRVVEEFAAIGGYGIRVTGGEPLCHPGWLDILQHSSALGFKAVALQTNAMLLRDGHLPALRLLDFPGLSIQVSLDGATARSHDLVRGEGAYSGALQGITRLVQAGLAARVALFFTEMRHNLGEIPELLDLADRMGLASVSTGAMVLCGRGSGSSLLAPPGVEQYLALRKRYDSDAHFRELYRKIGSVAALEWRAGDAARQDCCTFIENPYLTPSGRLYPCLLCHADEYSVSGVFEKGLAAAFVEGGPLWSSLLRISRSRTYGLAECRDCPGKPACAGGCMGRAWGSCGDLLAADDRCESRRTIYHTY